MKVGFCGSQCTGKSTQAELLGKNQNFIVVPSASRLAANMGVPVNREGTLSSQFVIMGKIEAQKYYYEQMKKTHYGRAMDLVYERTHVDSLAYSQTSNLWQVDEHYLICHRALAEEQMKNYFNLVFYFPAYELDEFLGEIDDGVRDIDPDYRLKVDNIIEAELDTIGCDYIVVPNAPPEDIHSFIVTEIFNKRVEISMDKHSNILRRLAD